MVLVLAEMLLLNLLKGLSWVLLQCSAAINTLQLLLGSQFLRLIVSSLQSLRNFMNHLRALIIATKILLVEEVLGRNTRFARRLLINWSRNHFLLRLFMNLNLFLIFQICGVGWECCGRSRSLTRPLNRHKRIVSAHIVMGIKSRFPLLLAVDDGDFLLWSKLIRSLGIAHWSSSDLCLAHLMYLLLVVIALHLVGAEVVVAAQVLLAVLDFDLELFGGSGGGDLGVQGLASVEGAVELLQAAVFGLSLAFLALRIRDRHRLLLMNILPWTLKRTMAPALVSWMGRQIRLSTMNFVLLENGC